MGAFKPLLPFGNKTVIECCVDYLRDGGVDQIVVVLGHRADDIRRKVSGVTVAHNPDPDSEMGASIAAGARALPETVRVGDDVDAPHHLEKRPLLLQRLRRENVELRADREILRKAAAYFARETMR